MSEDHKRHLNWGYNSAAKTGWLTLGDSRRGRGFGRRSLSHGRGLAATFAESISWPRLPTPVKLQSGSLRIGAESGNREIDGSLTPRLKKLWDLPPARFLRSTSRMLLHVSDRKFGLRRWWEELNLEAVDRTKIISLTVGLSAIFGSLIPSPFLFPVSTLFLSLVISALALAVLGAYKAKKRSVSP